jgi:hypothetical protein
LSREFTSADPNGARRRALEMGLSAQQDDPGRAVSLVMEPNSAPKIPGQGKVIDSASLFLCRQGAKWVVVIESPRIRGAVRLRHAGRDSFDARFELLSLTRRACPEASILSADGALEDADYEWRLEVRAVETHAGDLGVALHRALTVEPKRHTRRLSGRKSRRHCNRGRCPSFAGRPRTF